MLKAVDCRVGDNDATLILKSKPGSKRWQHMKLSPDRNDRHLEIDYNYTIIFGSHRNTCLKIERNSQECFRVSELPACIAHCRKVQTSNSGCHVPQNKPYQHLY